MPETPIVTGDLTSCYGNALTLIASSAVNKWDATDWVWYTDSNATNLLSSGDTIVLNPDNDTTYYLRGEGGCLVTTGPIGSVRVHRKQMTAWFEDQDGDGWGNTTKPTIIACAQPDGYTSVPGDCNDNHTNIALLKDMPYVSRLMGEYGMVVRLGKDDVPYAATHLLTVSSAPGLGSIQLTEYNGSTWDSIGRFEFEDTLGSYLDMVIGPDGLPYVAYAKKVAWNPIQFRSIEPK